LPAKLIISTAKNADPLIRLHTMRILLEQQTNEQNYQMVLHAVKDQDPHVARAAIENLVKYPSIQSLEAVLSGRLEIPDYDSHLMYTARLSTKDLLLNTDLMKQVLAKDWKPQDAANIADVLVDVPSPESAMFLAQHFSKYPLPSNPLITCEQIAQFIPTNMIDAVVIQARKKIVEPETEFVIFQGTQQRRKRNA
jgi:HEAT repeat protein